MAPALRTNTLWLLALLSGGAALAYELCWSRALVVPLGNSADATAVVLAAFMLGIALGARLGGAWAERVAHVLRVYALIEISLALYALFAPWLLGSLVAVGPVVRHGAAFLLVALPCLGMGATFPLLVRALTQDAPLARRVSVAYGANTLGAAVGACLTGFVGIASLGVAGSSRVAALAGAAAGLGALGLRSRPATGPAATVAQTAGPSRARAIVALTAAFSTGLSMLAAEVLWARVLTFVFGHDTYAFATLLALVLLGLAVGGLLHRVVADWDQTRVVAALLASFAFALVGSFGVAAWLVIAKGRDPFGFDTSGQFATSVWLELYRELAYTPVLLFLPAVLSGALFPATCSLYGHGASDAGRRVGTIGLVNGLGAAAGALLGATVLVPALGIQYAFLVLAVLAAATAGGVEYVGRGGGRRALVAALVPVAVTAVLAFVLPRELPRQMLLAVLGPRHVELLHYDEARTGTVSVTRNRINGERQLVINAVNEVTTRLVHDQSFKVLGHLAPLLHPNPQRAVMICLGAGLSAGAAAVHPLERLDVVDLSPAVSRGARYFADLNRNVLDDPIFHLHIADGRRFLLDAAQPYDVAIVDSTHPKAVDSWILYTREFYELIRQRLGPEGILIQWVPLHGMSEREFKILVATFQSVYPDMTLWANAGFETYGQVAYAKLVGSNAGPLRIDYARLAARLRGPAGDDLRPWGLGEPAELLDAFVAGPDAIRTWTEGLPVQTDDHPLVPYITRYSRGRRMVPSLLLAPREPVWPWLAGQLTAAERQRLDAAFDAQGLVLAGKLERARARFPEGKKLERFAARRKTTLPYYQRFAELYRDDPNRLFEAGTQLGTLGHPDAALPVLRRAHEIAPADFRSTLHLALLARAMGNEARAIELLTQLLTQDFDAPLVHQSLGLAQLASGEPGVAATHFEAALAFDPEALGARVALAEARLAEGDLDEAQRQAERAVVQNPWVADTHYLLAVLAAQRGDCSGAEQHRQRAAKIEPYTPRFLTAVGEMGTACR